MTIIGAFILGGILPFGVIGGFAGYYWALANVRRAVFQWFHKHWPDDYHSVCEQVFDHDFELSSTELH